VGADMDDPSMGWVGLGWIGLGWVRLNFVASVVSWVEFNDTVMVGSNDYVFLF